MVQVSLKLMSVLTGSREYEEKINCFSEEDKKKGRVTMCVIMQSRYEEGIREGESRGAIQGKTEAIVSLVQEGLISNEVGAQRLNMSLEEFDALLQA